MPTDVVCIGTTLIDELFFCTDNVVMGTSNPARIKKTIGGVMGNIAQHLQLLNVNVDFITVLGNDPESKWIASYFFEKNINLLHSLKVDDVTGKYVAIHDNEGFLQVAACYDESYHYLTIDFLKEKTELLKTAHFIVCDTNISAEVIEWLLAFCNGNGNKLIIEPVSVLKAQKLSNLNLKGLFMVTPNEDELPSLCMNPFNEYDHNIDNLLSKGIQNIWLRRGSKGSVIYNSSGHFQLPATPIEIQDTTGAGDAALAAWIWASLHQFNPTECLAFAHSLAFEVLQQEGAVLFSLNENKLAFFKEKYYPNESLPFTN